VAEVIAAVCPFEVICVDNGSADEAFNQMGDRRECDEPYRWPYREFAASERP
jgi:hypothetical protein